jgi:hypothetical protein
MYCHLLCKDACVNFKVKPEGFFNKQAMRIALKLLVHYQ